jgi:hypothetical protein
LAAQDRLRRNHSATGNTDEINFDYIEDEDETETVSNDGNLTEVGVFSHERKHGKWISKL